MATLIYQRECKYCFRCKLTNQIYVHSKFQDSQTRIWMNWEEFSQIQISSSLVSHLESQYFMYVSQNDYILKDASILQGYIVISLCMFALGIWLVEKQCKKNNNKQTNKQTNKKQGEITDKMCNMIQLLTPDSFLSHHSLHCSPLEKTKLGEASSAANYSGISSSTR